MTVNLIVFVYRMAYKKGCRCKKSHNRLYGFTIGYMDYVVSRKLVCMLRLMACNVVIVSKF